MFDGYSFKIAQTTIAGTRTPNLQAQRTATYQGETIKQAAKWYGLTEEQFVAAATDTRYIGPARALVDGKYGIVGQDLIVYFGGS